MKKREMRNAYRVEGFGKYHFCTDGLRGRNLFNSAEEFAYGMFLVGLLRVKFNIMIIAFTLMPNHIHIILEASGETCLNAFDFLKRKISQKLKIDGYPPLPEDYFFHLEKIRTQEQLKNEIIYVLRNCLEKDYGLVGCYPWTSAWIYYSGLADVISIGATPASQISKRNMETLLCGHEQLPGDWMIHPYIGLMPTSFVDKSVVLELFPKPKDMQTAVVKDYERFFEISKRLGEMEEFSKSEILDIVNHILQKRFEGKTLNILSPSDKGKMAIILNREYGLNSYQISTSIFIKEKVVRQLLDSKELR